MRFTAWKPDGNAIVRIYIKGSEAYIWRKSVRHALQVSGANLNFKQEVTNFLLSVGIDLNNIVRRADLAFELFQRGLIENYRPPRNSTPRGKVDIDAIEIPVHDMDDTVVSFPFGGRDKKEQVFPKTPRHHFDGAYMRKSNSERAFEANRLDVSSIKMKPRTRKGARVKMAHGEPEEIFHAIRMAGIDVEYAHLKDGDFIITNTVDSSRELLIERKTIRDLSKSIKDDKTHHAHDQVERYSIHRENQQNEGIFTQVAWMMEYEDEGQVGLYNALELVQQMDGWVAYQVAINDQHVIHTYNKNHTAYLIVKFIQCFFEQQLFHPVTVGGVRLDRTKAERNGVVKPANSDHGVLRAKSSVEGALASLPGINSAVARELARGRNILDVAGMSIDELMTVNGIAEKTAVQIYEMFRAIG